MRHPVDRLLLQARTRRHRARLRRGTRRAGGRTVYPRRTDRSPIHWPAPVCVLCDGPVDLPTVRVYQPGELSGEPNSGEDVQVPEHPVTARGEHA